MLNYYIYFHELFPVTMIACASFNPVIMLAKVFSFFSNKSRNWCLPTVPHVFINGRQLETSPESVHKYGAHCEHPNNGQKSLFGITRS